MGIFEYMYVYTVEKGDDRLLSWQVSLSPWSFEEFLCMYAV